MPDPIELTEEAVAWVEARTAVLTNRTLDILVGGDRDDTVPVVPYAAEAANVGGLLDTTETDDAGYPLSKATTEELLNAYRDTEVPANGRTGVALSRQITLLESFRKQLIGRRSMRSAIVAHQAEMEAGRMPTNELTQLYMVGGSLE